MARMCTWASSPPPRRRRWAKASLRVWYMFAGTAPWASPSRRVPAEATKPRAECTAPAPGRVPRRRSSASRGAPRAVALLELRRLCLEAVGGEASQPHAHYLLRQLIREPSL